MFKNIGKRIHTLAIILAILSLVGFLALTVVFLLSMLQAENQVLRTAGLQGTIICAVLAVLTPLFSWILYGFGTLVQNSEKQAENSREMKEMLRHALSEGALSEDISRKLAQAVAKIAPPAPSNGRPPQAARPVARPAAPVAPAAPVPPAAPVEPAAPVTPIAPVTPAAPVTPVAPITNAEDEVPVTPVAPVTPVTPTGFPSTVRPLGKNDQTF